MIKELFRKLNDRLKKEFWKEVVCLVLWVKNLNH